MLEMRIHGFGGQGAVTLAQLTAISALNAGKVAQALPFFGTERRGSAVKACVRISDEKIKIRSQSTEADLLVIMNQKLLAIGLSEGVKPGAIVILNTPHPHKADYPLYYLDANQIALDNDLVVSGVPFINIPILGAVCNVVGISKKHLEKALRDKWTGVVANKNVKAALTGYDSVKKVESEA